MLASTYAEDTAFLGRYAPLIELAAGPAARVAVAPTYQGRVMTSTLAGPRGRSFGWLNTRFIASGAQDVQFNNYGGEDRFWLGPESGQFGLFHAKGEPFDVAHWKTPPGFNTGPFQVVRQTKDSVTLRRDLEVVNYAGTTFRCAVRRVISMLSKTRAGKGLGVSLPAAVKLVAFESRNTLTHIGPDAWTQAGGLVSIWILGQFKPLPHGKVIVPFKGGDEGALGPKATTTYFGAIPPARCQVAEDHLLLVCDGQYRSKIGIAPARATRVLGSFDPDGGVLTIAQFNLPRGAARLPYVNSLWEMQEKPFGGDVVNSYNDGEASPGAGQLGPFYELETSSPAAQLPPGKAMTHCHRTLHFAGPAKALGAVARKVLGVDLKKIG
ncbi:MAG: hypothetical protein MUP47_11505 [Phycisphaerae bacterium]|nr:hypothetical protein [Phycisphaerae bacterium]